MYEDKMKTYISANGVGAEHLRFNASCHSVEEAAETVGASPKDFVKSICLLDPDGNLIVGVVKGEDRVSTSRVGKILGIERPRTALPEEILEKTGYPCGGTPPFGFEALFLIDPKVTEKELVYAGGGSETSLLRVPPEELQRANGGKVVRIRK
ncbi:YbaK/prolyl-tRNA synthetase associated region [Methanosarcina sp. MTP4]|uniref:aminoacyl-tRNA deacylase n=1 Tax=Methanosarcina sp. MTP4 TaxID=1434100 RepID=UPI00061592D1|nr:YbaK/EbsC family protein [Methanosarcina sp. MTP4]AKB26096.1 YbaK/prolyl-tRNA synthetase associated region [Methanosarcina sp. MTP4]